MLDLSSYFLQQKQAKLVQHGHEYDTNKKTRA